MTDPASVLVKVRGRSRRYELVEGELATVGRGSSCAVRIEDQSVSRQHCVAVFARGLVTINDLNSTHGVLFRGEPVDRCELQPGEGCHLGNAYFVFEDALVDPGPEKIAERSGPMAVEDARSEVSETSVEDPPPQPPSTPGSSVEVAGYQVLEPLGEGGFGVVYRARQVRLGREVALKILRKDSDEVDEKRIAAFEREARAAAAINDPHLVQVFDVGNDEGTHYLSMELVAGGSLAQQVRQDGPMEWRSVLSLLRDMAFALKAAHESGLVHRDIKPANILLTLEGRAKLTDLGLAADIFDAAKVDAGTVAFMAPEQLQRREADERSDIYALGCTVYAALAGRAPFRGDRKEVARAHVQETPDSLQGMGIQVPWHLEQLIIDSMMAKDPTERPQSAVHLLDRLDRLILPGQGLPARGRPTQGRSTQGPTAPGAPRAGEGPTRVRYVRSPQKEFAARVVSETIVVLIVTFLVLATLLLLKYRWPEIDIYRLIGKQ